MNILGIDPGRQKTGLAIVDKSGQILWRAVVPTPQLRENLEPVFEKWDLGRIALGHSTGSEDAEAVVKSALTALGAQIEVEIVNERDSTLQARALYFEAHPLTGWRRLVPQGLQPPTEPIDDFAAAILARRALEGKQ